jgi:hypothetical protein
MATTGIDGVDGKVLKQYDEKRLRRILNLTGQSRTVDGRARYTNGARSAVFATTHHADLAGKGWTLVELLDTAGL